MKFANDVHPKTLPYHQAVMRYAEQFEWAW